MENQQKSTSDRQPPLKQPACPSPPQVVLIFQVRQMKVQDLQEPQSVFWKWLKLKKRLWTKKNKPKAKHHIYKPNLKIKLTKCTRYTSYRSFTFWKPNEINPSTSQLSLLLLKKKVTSPQTPQAKLLFRQRSHARRRFVRHGATRFEALGGFGEAKQKLVERNKKHPTNDRRRDDAKKGLKKEQINI